MLALHGISNYRGSTVFRNWLSNEVFFFRSFSLASRVAISDKSLLDSIHHSEVVKFYDLMPLLTSTLIIYSGFNPNVLTPSPNGSNYTKSKFLIC